VAATDAFVGRVRELGRLRAAVDAAQGGPASLVVVHGEAGIGKTRTVAEFARSERRRGTVVLWGTCYQGGVVPPYGPWVDALGTYARSLEAGALGELLGADAPVLADFVPAIRRALPDVPEAAALPPDQARLRLYEAVARFVEALEPVLVFDDLQWADGDALELLVHVARYAHAVIVAVHRGSELDIGHPVMQRLAEIGRRRPSEYILLPSLELDEAAELLARAAGHPVEPEVVETIYSESGGNPFFLGELGRHLHQHARALSDGTWRPPESVRQAVALRLATLSHEGRRAIELASVFSAGFSFDELLALTRLDEDTLLDCVDEALAVEVIRPAGAERYDFAHTLVRHTLYDGFSASRRARLHRRLAGVLEQLHAGRLEEVAAELARQYHASSTLAGRERGVTHALMAAEHARAAAALAEAEMFLHMALDLAPAADVASRGQILAQLALTAAEESKLEEATRALEEALDLLEGSGALGDAIAHTVYEVVSALQDALANQSTLEPLIARGFAALGDVHGLPWARLKLLERPCEIVPAGPVYAARWLGFDPEAVRIARTEGTEADFARTIDHFGPWPLADVEEVVPRVLAWRDPVARLRGLVVLTWNVTVTRWSGIAPPAERLIAEIDALGSELGSAPARAMASMFRAAVLGAQGDFPAAAAGLAEAEPFVDRLPDDHRVALVGTLVGALTRQHVDPDWQQLADRMLDIAVRREQVPWFGFAWASVACHAYARGGMARDARRVLAYIMPGIRAANPWDYAQNCAAAYAGEAVWVLRDAKLAAPLLPAALALIEVGAGDYYMASNDLTAARLMTLLDRFDTALEHFGRARATAEQRDHRPLQAIIDHDEALARLRMQRPGAGPLVERAMSQFRALGMTEWERRAQEHERAPAPLPDGLTAREAEILRLLADGLTNKEIAAELVVSVHTVERHVQNAYRKISVRNRADATAYVVRTEL
jgi:DNA-binding CsgD family transcriptional regulator